MGGDRAFVGGKPAVFQAPPGWWATLRPLPPAGGAFSFLQISDSHIGFSKPANPDALGTLREAIAKIKALPEKPAFMIHTGDITHLSKDGEFDQAEQIIREAGLPVFYVPGEHDLLDDGRGRSYLQRYGKNAVAPAGKASTATASTLLASSMCSI